MECSKEVCLGDKLQEDEESRRQEKGTGGEENATGGGGRLVERNGSLGGKVEHLVRFAEPELVPCLHSGLILSCLGQMGE